jgi:hypothetical protein
LLGARARKKAQPLQLERFFVQESAERLGRLELNPNKAFAHFNGRQLRQRD